MAMFLMYVGSLLYIVCVLKANGLSIYGLTDVLTQQPAPPIIRL